MPIRPATRDDVPALVSIHLQAFERFFLTQLGPAFLHEYYRAVHKHSSGIALVASSAGEVQGFVAGFVDPSSFYRRLRSRRFHLAMSALPGLLRRPALLPRLLDNMRRANQNGSRNSSPRESELASIAVLPSVQGKGVGRLLVQAFVSQSQALGADCVSLTTDADANDTVNRFYLQLGFRIDEVFHSGGNRRMHRFKCDLGTMPTDDERTDANGLHGQEGRLQGAQAVL